MRKAVIFDVDGTIWDAVDRITESFQIRAHEFPDVTSRVDTDTLRSYMGKPMDEFAELFPELSEERAIEVLKACCNYEIEYLKTHPGVLYEGIYDVFEELSKDYEIYIVSNCQEGYIEALLESCNMEQFVSGFECYGRTGQSKGKNIKILMERYELEKAIYVGDTQLDYEATLEAGIPFIYAAYGMGQVEHNRYVADSPREIKDVIKATKYFEL